MLNPRKQRREERRESIRQNWAERHDDLARGLVTLAEILSYDDPKLMKLAGKGLRLFKVGKLKPALKIFHGLVVLDPFVPYFHYLLGSVLEKQGDLQGAAREYSKVIEQTEGAEPPPDILPFAVLGLGRVLVRQGDRDAALSMLRPLADGRLASSDPSINAAARLITAHLDPSGSA